jgi:DNA-binding MarR family transcriptional regulator
MAGMLLTEAVWRVQSAYPKIYLACHTRHQKARTTGTGLSQRDATILAHLSDEHGKRHIELAQHLSLARSTLSEAMAWLLRCGYVEREGTLRQLRWKLSASGRKAASQASVLESARVARMLRRLTPAERSQAIAGLELLAAATQELKGRKQ